MLTVQLANVHMQTNSKRDLNTITVKKHEHFLSKEIFLDRQIILEIAKTTTIKKIFFTVQ